MAGHGSAVFRRRQRAPSPAGALVIIALVTIAGVAGFILFLSIVAPPRADPPVVPGRLVAGDLVLELQNAGWIMHDEIGGPVPAGVEDGFQMPASTMPGMPDPGTHRLYLQAVVGNTGSGDATFAPRDFSVRSTSGATWPLNQPATFAAASLQPGQTRSLDLLFDVPDTVADLDLVWAHAGQLEEVPVDAAPPPIHDHGGGY
jgi:hypothetical protein